MNVGVLDTLILVPNMSVVVYPLVLRLPGWAVWLEEPEAMESMNEMILST